MSYIYHPMQMHLHAGHEPFSSVEGHIANTAMLGMQYVWITEHDMRMGVRKYPVRSFDFSCGEMMYADAFGNKCGWEPIGTPEIYFTENAMNIVGDGELQSGVRFFSSGKRHAVSLLADLTLTFGIKHTNDVGKVFVEICLSQHPKDKQNGRVIHESVKMVYALDAPSEGEIPLVDNGNGAYELCVSADAEKYAIGGMDNAFLTAQIICENGAACSVDRFELGVQHSFQPVLDKQRELADEIGKRYGVKPFVSFEISEAGQHKNCFSTEVPIINYGERGYDVTQSEAICHVKNHGGIFSYNHPFEKYKLTELTNGEKEMCIYREAAMLAATGVYGASLTEIGFTEGRNNFSFPDHLKLWDMLSLSGVFITGYGDSDSHNNNIGWYDGNNFAAWIAADSSLEFPVPEREFVESMKAGRLYTGDPVYLKAPIDFTAEGCPMGAILTVGDRDYKARTMKFTADSVGQNWKMRVVVNGDIAYEEILTEGEVNYTFEVEPRYPVSFARVELYNADGRCIMLTNPIYLVRTAEILRELPRERIYEKGVL